jgi:hypothetical protein
VTELSQNKGAIKIKAKGKKVCLFQPSPTPKRNRHTKKNIRNISSLIISLKNKRSSDFSSLVFLFVFVRVKVFLYCGTRARRSLQSHHKLMGERQNNTKIRRRIETANSHCGE